MEANFIQNSLQLAPPAALLDVPCGNGRLSIELTSRGFNLTAVDISESFLREGQAVSRQNGFKIDWQLREMRDLPWQSHFGGAFCFGNSFGYLDDQGNLEFLKAVHRVLTPNGRSVLDASSVAENVLPKIQDHTEMQIGDIRFIEDNRYDHVSGRLDTEYTFVRGNQTEKKFGSHRLYTYRELETLLAEAGFKIHLAVGSLDGEAFRFGSQALFFLVGKE
ncbi:MAG: class I SAM-dependent methyltransferase [Bacteroidota bacterium]